LVAFWPVISGGRSFFHLDLRYEHLPVWAVTQKALLAGESPFWIDGEYCGHPLLFHSEAPIFYPLTAPLLWTGASVGRLADIFSLLHFWLAGFAAFLLLRDVQADRLSALWGGIAWMLSARLVQSAIWPNAVAVAALLPFLLLAVSRIAQGRRRSGIVLASTAGGLAILASRPHVLLAAAPVLLTATAALIAFSARPGRALRDLALAGVLAIALGAVALFPATALYPEMSRAAGLSLEARDARPIRISDGLADVFLPIDRLGRWPESAAYAGFLVYAVFLFGALLVLRRGSGLQRRLFLGLSVGGIIGLAFAFGEKGPYGWIASLPIFAGFRIPARYLLSWSLAIALASALAFSAIQKRWRRPWPARVALLLLIGELVAHAWRAAPTAIRGLDSVEPGIVSDLRRSTSRLDEAGFPRRYWSLAEKMNVFSFAERNWQRAARDLDPAPFALGMRFGLESVDGAGPPIQRIQDVFSRVTLRAIELGGVSCVVTSPSRSGAAPAPPVIEATSPLPRALLVAAAVPVDPAKAPSFTLAPAFNPRRVAIVEDMSAFLQGTPSEPTGSVRLLSRRPSHLELATNSPGDRFLVIFDAFEKGWRGYVDGKETEVFRANGAFRGVRVPAGDHHVTEIYKPPGLREGVAFSLAGCLGLLLIAKRMAE
jgi:hypothetical protein